MSLKPIFDKTGWRHLALDDIDSTNAEALRLAQAGEGDGLWITAKTQQSGRGRLQRHWVSEPGNLFASLLLIEPARVSRLTTLSIVAALSVYDTLRPLVGIDAQSFGIKWPNDVLVNGAKVSGILIESRPLSYQRLAVVIGVGINITSAPQIPDYPTASLAQYGVATTRSKVFDALVGNMAENLNLWQSKLKTGLLRQRWSEAILGVGQPISVKEAGKVRSGRMEGVDSDGFLLLKDDDGIIHKIRAGDVTTHVKSDVL